MRLQTGCSQREVATEIRVSQSVISRLQQRHRETGRVTERHRSGHPLDTSHADDRFIVNSALRNRMMKATQLQARLREVRGTRVTRQTIQNRLHQHGLCARRPARVPDHTTRHRRHRLACREHLRWTRNQWTSVLLSDESRFPLSRNDGRQCCWRCQGEHYASATIVWCYTLGRTTLHLVNGTATNQYYPNNIINPVIVRNTCLISSSWTIMPQLIGVASAAGGWGTSNGVACTFSRPESHRKPIGSAESSCRGSWPCTPEPQWPEGSPSRRVECHASADNESTCEQHETSLSSCNWCSRTHDKLLRHWHFLLWSTHHCC